MPLFISRLKSLSRSCFHSRFQSFYASLDRFGRSLESYVLPPLFAVLLLTVIWVTVFSLISLERTSAQHAAAALSLDLVETYEAKTLRNLEVIYKTLRVVKYAREQSATKFSIPRLQASGLLPNAKAFTIGVADRDGNFIVDNQAGQLIKNIADQPYFRVHAERDSGTPFVGLATLASVSGEWELPFSLRLNAPDGSFNGAVVFFVDVDYFTTGYVPLKFGLHGFLGMMGQDGKFRVRRSGDKVSWSEPVDYGLMVLRLEHRLPSADAIVTPWDGVRHFAQVRRLQAYPLAVIVGLSEDEQLATYRQHKRTYLWQGILASALLLIMFAALTYLARQLAASRMQTRQAHESYHAKIQAQVEEKERFLAATSHDLRTPLTRMKLRLESLGNRSEREKLQQDVREMAEVLDATLNYFRNNAQPEERQLLDINALALALADDARESGRNLLVVGTASPILVQPVAVRSCIANLVQNALRYGKDVELHLIDTADLLVIEVRDRGPGIPDENLSAVFEPFVRLEPSRNKETGGFGLGLSIALAAAKQNHGEIMLSNAPDGGLVARLSFQRMAE